MMESDIERELHRQVTWHGGTTRKFESRARAHNPDRIIIWPGKPAVIHFAECKAEGKVPRPGQRREIKRLREMGCTVFLIDSYTAVEVYVTEYRPK